MEKESFGPLGKMGFLQQAVRNVEGHLAGFSTSTPLQPPKKETVIGGFYTQANNKGRR